ncbi:hypothetical protein [Cohnella lupini]|uniref:O-antigen ligase-like membrane protein n=1 Tax=Cohnella lupini TaxID=1294267 RepID=A0A3D9ITH0_9BACL|nr:hypothetical protein [Cohnella lupini]RED65071.1 hypothetical protein DFP95_102493 [Cohnella lupini]
MEKKPSNRLEVAIMYAYLFLLPFNSGIMKDSLHSLSSSVSFIPHLLGIALMAVLIFSRKRDYRPSAVVKKVAFIILLLNLSTLIMAIIQFKELGTLFGRNTIIAASPQIMYYVQMILALVYNDYIFSQLELKKVVRVIIFSFVTVGIVGYSQIITILTGNGLTTAIAEMVTRFTVMDEVYVLRVPKLNLLTPEASTAGAQIACFILPLLLSLTKHKKIGRGLGIGLIAAYIPIIIFNNSSSGFLGVIICIACFLYLLPFRKRIPIWNLRILLILSTLLIATINFNAIKGSDFFERTFLKAVDTENLSTLHRTTSIYTNMQSLKDYPLLGVGNGIQGFYYIKYFPNWGFQSVESTELYYGEGGWPGSGAFVFTFLSAFGVMGILLLGYIIYLVNRNVRLLKKTPYRFVYDYAFLGSVGLLFQAYSTIDIIGNFYAIFIISFAMVRHDERDPIAEYATGSRLEKTEMGFNYQTAVRSNI